MPKDAPRKRSRVHHASIKSTSLPPHSTSSIVATPSNPELFEPVETLTKREKQSKKHQALMSKVAASTVPYSKSHSRRLKRRAKEQLVGGLTDLETELSKLESDLPGPSVPESSSSQPKGLPTSKTHPLTAKQRARTLKIEQVRVPMILKNPSFIASPWETIATHAKNTLSAGSKT